MKSTSLIVAMLLCGVCFGQSTKPTSQPAIVDVLGVEGAGLQELAIMGDENPVKKLNVPSKDGLFLASVQPDGPAAKAGIAACDIIVSVDGKTITCQEDVAAISAKTKEGAKCSVIRLSFHLDDERNIVWDKKTVIVTAAVIPAKQINQNEHGFRGLAWGTSKEEVLKKEGRPLKEIGSVLVYLGRAANMNCFYALFFVDNKLCRGKYIFLDSHSSDDAYLRDFASVQVLLQEKYGKPTKEDVVITDKSSAKHVDDLTHSIALGFAYTYARWETSIEDIILIMDGGDGKISVRLEYSSKQLSDKEGSVKKGETLKGL